MAGIYVTTKAGGLVAPAAKLPTSSASSVTVDVWSAAGSGASTGAPGNGVLTFAPLDVAAAFTLSGVGVDITGAGAGGSPVVRLGLYASDAQGWPGVRLDEFGSVSAAGVGVFTLTSMSRALSPGRYWLAAVCQGATITQPTLRTLDGALSIPSSTAAEAATAVGVRCQGATNTGSLPATAVSGGLFQGAAVVPRLVVRSALS